MCPEKPGSMKPAVEWVSRPSRPSDDLPSSRPARSSGSVQHSSVEPSTNSPGCRTNGSPSVACTRVVSSSLALRGSIWGVARVVEHPEQVVQRRTSTLDGCTQGVIEGSMPSRPAAISARRSRSESSTRRAYTGTPRVSVGRTAPGFGTDGRSCGSWYPSAAPSADVVQWQNISFLLNTRVRFRHRLHVEQGHPRRRYNWTSADRKPPGTLDAVDMCPKTTIGGGGHRGRLGHRQVHCGGAGIGRRPVVAGDIDAGAAAETDALIRGVG